MQQTIFGSLANGSEASLFTLRNARGFEAHISNYGATLVSLLVPTAQGERFDVVLGYDTLAEYEADNASMGIMCGRYANRIAKAELPIGNQVYTLDQNHGDHHLHGGTPGFGKVLWQAVDRSTPDMDVLELSYLSPDGEAGFPGNLTVKVTFSLLEDGLQLDYWAQTDQKTVINLANHAYFNIAGQAAGSVGSHQLQIYAHQMLETDSDLIPTGTYLAVAQTPFDFQSPKEIGLRIDQKDDALTYGSGYDHCFVLAAYDGSLQPAALYASSDLQMEVWTTQPGIQVYTANHLHDVPGKGGHTYQARHAVCLETQHFPDSPHHSHFPSTLLDPVSTYQEQVIYRFK